MRFTSIKSAACLVVVGSLLTFHSTARADVSFLKDVAPLLLKKCTGCHGEKSNQGGYRAHTFQYLMKPAASGLRPVVPGKPAESTLYRLVASSISTVRMPKYDDALSAPQIELIRKWIVEGAHYDGPDQAMLLRLAIGPRKQPPAPATYTTAVPVFAVALAPGGKSVAVAGYHEVLIYSAQGVLLRRIGGLPQRIQSLSFSADGATLLTAGGSPGEYGEADVIHLSGAAKPEPLGTYLDVALTAVYDKTEQKIAVGSADGGVSVYSAASLKRQWVSNLHSDWVTAVSFSQDGRFVASASKDMTVKLHNAQDGTLYTTYTGHNKQLGQYRGQDPVYSVRFSSATDTAASAGGGKWIQLWNPEKTKEEAGSAADMEERFMKQGHTKYLPHGFTRPVLATVLSDNRLFAASADGQVKEFDIAEMKEVQTFAGHHDWVCTVDFDRASGLLATGSSDGEVKLWESKTGQCLHSFFARPTGPTGPAR